MRRNRVRILSFLGQTIPTAAVEPHEDYWRLIGQTGKVVEYGPTDPTSLFFGKSLVLFDIDVVGLDLNCHNEVPNTLWISNSDLIVLSSGEVQ